MGLFKQAISMEFDVSIVVCTYNPEKRKLLNTIQSVLMQKDIRYEIIIADDGSNKDHFEDVKQFMDKEQFYEYKFIKNEINQGTVLNCLYGVQACHGKYIKLISPGDMLSFSSVLREWVDEIEREQADWSFGDAFYYKRDQQDRMVFIEEDAHPRMVDVYLHGDRKRCKDNYLINHDNCLGAATLCKKDILLKYLDLISGKIVYAEDNMYYLMMFDDLKTFYFPQEVIFYEFGEGVSTSGNAVWRERLKKDWEVTCELILDKCAGNEPFEGKVRRAIKIKNTESKLIRYLYILFFKDMFAFKIKKRLKNRKTRVYSGYENSAV